MSYLEEKAKLSFVTTKFDGVYALKLSKHLPVHRDERFAMTPLTVVMTDKVKEQWKKKENARALLHDGSPYFTAVQSGLVITIVEDEDSAYERRWFVTVESQPKSDEGGSALLLYKVPVKEYEVLLIGKGRADIVSETVYNEAYDLGNKAMSRQDYALLLKHAKENTTRNIIV